MTALDLTLHVSTLKPLVERIVKVVERRNTIPILSNLVLRAEADGRVEVEGTDLDIWLRTRSPEDRATVRAAGAVTVPALLLNDILKKTDGDITLKLEGAQVSVRAGRSRFKLHALPVEDFPEAGSFAKMDGAAGLDLPGGMLTGIHADVGFAISTEETRYYLNGIYLHADPAGQGLVAVATDGHRMSRRVLPSIPAPAGMPPAILPRKTCGLTGLIADSLDDGELIRVSVTTGAICFETDALVLHSKLIDGTFPDYNRVIPTGNDRIATVKRTDLVGAVERVAAISSTRGRAIKLTFDGADLALAMADADSGDASDVIEAVAEGIGEAPLVIGFNARYLADILGTFPGPDIRIAMSASEGPAVITDPANAERLTILMPMRVA